MTTIITIGRITKDFELRKSEKGCVYANFNIAVNEGVGGSQKTMFYECTVFGADANALLKQKHVKAVCFMSQVSLAYRSLPEPMANPDIA